MNRTKLQHAVSCALILGAVLVVKFLLTVSDNNGFFAFAVIFLAVFVPYLVYRFQKKYRDTELGGAISYVDALTYGIVLYAAAAVILGMVQFIYYRYINPDFLAEQFRLGIEQLQIFGMPQNIIDEAIKIGVPSPAASVFSEFVIHCFWGLLMALVTSAIVKKTKENEQ
ncbi:MAG: DUF4199 domain-containing protein [Prevotellaceae bacterium]|jgi:hypothetical protein|nr:DUF4199 domain-containing protein [Prevotellaceae bacterium]